MKNYKVEFSIITDALLMGIDILEQQVESVKIESKLKIKPNNFVLDTWIDYQPLINGRTLVWYYCSVLDEIRTKVI